MPVIWSYYQEQALKSALRKNYSILSQAFNLAYGYDYDDFRDWDYAFGNEFLMEVANKLSKYLHIMKTCEMSEAGKCFGLPMHAKGGKLVSGTSETGITGWGEGYFFVLNDGTSVALDITTAPNAGNLWGVSENFINPNAVLLIMVDVNGNKKPNVTGKDIFGFVLTNKGLVPAGINSSTNCENMNSDLNVYCTA